MKIETTTDLDNPLARVDFAFTDGSHIAVWHLGADYDPSFGAYRQRYFYSVTAGNDASPRWEYLGDDIRSGCGSEPDTRAAAAALFSFLNAAAEAYGRPYSDNADLFPSHVMQWCTEHDDELAVAGSAMDWN